MRIYQVFDKTEKIRHLQLSSLLKLLHVTLTFPHATSRKENVFMVTVHVLSPCRQPCHSIVVLDCLPISRHVGNGDFCVFADVDGDIFRSHAELRKITGQKPSRRSHIEYLL